MNDLKITALDLPKIVMQQPDSSPLQKAVECYIRRQNRDEHPEGHFDNAKRWYPSEHEGCTCCKYIRTPSRGFPFNLMVHCRTVSHVSQLFGVEKSELRKSVNAFKKVQTKASIIGIDA